MTITKINLADLPTCSFCDAKTGIYCVRKNGGRADEIHAPRARVYIRKLGDPTKIFPVVVTKPSQWKGGNTIKRLSAIQDQGLNVRQIQRDKTLWVGAPERAILADLDRHLIALEVQS